MELSERKINMKDLSCVREFFSHNIRTSTAMVVATVMVFKYSLCEDDENGADIISESAYFLDVYDKGMDICFDFVLGQPVQKHDEEIFPSKIVKHFEGKLPLTIQEQGVTIDACLDNFSTKNNAHITKAIIEIILCQEVRNAKGRLVIKGENGVYTMENHRPIGNPPAIYIILQSLLAKLDIEFSFTDNTISMRFM